MRTIRNEPAACPCLLGDGRPLIDNCAKLEASSGLSFVLCGAMVNGTLLRDCLEGRRGPLAAAALRVPLMPLAVLFGAVAGLRRAAYRRGWLQSVRLPVPVLSIGNLTAGGTGKTPMTILLARALLQRGRKPAVLTRGYGSADPDQADEVRLLRDAVPGLRVYAGADRVHHARRALADGADVLLLDDGFQHLKLARDLDIVLLDATSPFGGGWPLPAGLLREWPSALRYAHLFVLTRTNEAPAAAVDRLRRHLRERYPSTPQVACSHAPVGLCGVDGRPHGLDTLQGAEVRAFCGIGRPDSFFESLRRLGAVVIEQRTFGDHHAFRALDVPLKDDGRLAVCTAKDAVKLRGVLPEAQAARVRVLQIELHLDDEQPLAAALDKVLGEPAVDLVAIR